MSQARFGYARPLPCGTVRVHADRLFGIGVRSVFGLLIFAVLATAILTRAPKWLSDFDQAFYLTIAYDLDRHGVFSNGMFDDVNSAVAAPPPGCSSGRSIRG